ncbi:insulinase family protein [Candidatus Poribacteria bacterium]|nr:insulinase family protein [Candidatus Poribacteria bacterium]
MKLRHTLRFLAVGVLAASSLLLGACAGIPSHPDKIHAPVIEFVPPKPEVRTLSNGIAVYLLPNHELPLVSGTLVVQAGSLADPEDKEGVAELAGSTMRLGGSANQPGADMDEELEFLAASVESASSSRTFTVSMNALAKDTARVLEIMSDVARHPAFPQDRLDVSKARMLDGIHRRKDEPNRLAQFEFRRRLYGEDSPFAREVSEASLEAISRDDLVAWHKSFIGPRNTQIGFSGDFDPDWLMERLETAFGDWDASAQQDFVYPDPITGVTPGVFFVNKADLTQTTIRSGHEGVTLRHPDEYIIQVYNEIFGMGSFSSRLMREVRSNRGLAYGAQGGIIEGKGGGTYIAATQTKNETAREAYDVMLDVMRGMREAPVTDEELELAKNSIENSFVFKFNNTHSIVTKQMELDRDGYPADYLETYLDRIRAVTAEDVQRVARERTHPENLVLVIVAPAEQVAPGFNEFGAVQTVEAADLAK